MNDPKSAFCYAAKFDYPVVADAAAPHTLGESLQSMEQSLEGYPTTVYAWVSLPFVDLSRRYLTMCFPKTQLRYREQYLLFANALVTEPPPYVNAKNQEHYCHGWTPYFNAVMEEVPRTVLDIVIRLVEKRIVISDIFDRHAIGECSNGISCSRRAYAWQKTCKELWARIKPFHTFLE